ncbi:MAG: DUF938 domain-containing protein [Sulfitobacter sp.]
MSRKLPPSASIATPVEGAKLHAPSAERNADHIAALLKLHGPAVGQALEIASGTGQHIITFAAALPDLRWQPTDIAADRLRSIDSYVQSSGVRNVKPAHLLNATTAGWSADHGGQDLIVVVNLLHLISAAEARIVLAEAAQALSPTGAMLIYGPFKRAGALTSEADQRFDAELREADPVIGYKDTQEMQGWFADVGLTAISQDMPANNLAFIARKTTP